MNIATMYGYGYGFDPTLILIIMALLITVAASLGLRATYSKYSKIQSDSRLTGAQTAEQLLRNAGITDVRVEHVAGDLTDHYDPRSKVVRLSDAVYNRTSIAAVAVAAHECGHAIQHQRDYIPMKMRSAIVPVVNIASNLSIPLFIIGIIIAQTPLVSLGIILFASALFFQIVTLPVEFNASSRALVALNNNGILAHHEVSQARTVLTAAALTYVAAAISTLLQLIRMILISRSNN